MAQLNDIEKLTDILPVQTINTAIYMIGDEKLTISQIIEWKKKHGGKTPQNMKRLKDLVKLGDVAPGIEPNKHRLQEDDLRGIQKTLNTFALAELTRVKICPSISEGKSNDPDHSISFTVKFYNRETRRIEDFKQVVTIHPEAPVQMVYYPTYEVKGPDTRVIAAARRQDIIAGKEPQVIPGLEKHQEPYVFDEIKAVVEGYYFGTTGLLSQIKRLQKNKNVANVSDDIRLPVYIDGDVQAQKLSYEEYKFITDTIMPLSYRPINILDPTDPRKSLNPQMISMLYDRGEGPEMFRRIFFSKRFPPTQAQIDSDIASDLEPRKYNQEAVEKQFYLSDQGAFRVFAFNATSDSGFPFNQKNKEVGTMEYALSTLFMKQLGHLTNENLPAFLHTWDFRRLAKMVPKPEVYNIAEKKDINRNIFGTATWYYIPAQIGMNASQRDLHAFPQSFTLYKWSPAHGGLQSLVDSIVNITKYRASLYTSDNKLPAISPGSHNRYLCLNYADNLYIIDLKLGDILAARERVKQKAKEEKWDESKIDEEYKKVRVSNIDFDWYSLDMSSHEASHKPRDIMYSSMRTGQAAFAIQPLGQGEIDQILKQPSTYSHLDSKSPDVSRFGKPFEKTENKIPQTCGTDYEAYFKFDLWQTIMNTAAVIGHAQILPPGMPSGIAFTFKANTELSALVSYQIMKLVPPDEVPVTVDGALNPTIEKIFNIAGMKAKLEKTTKDVMKPLREHTKQGPGKVVEMDLLGFDAVPLTIGKRTEYIAVLNYQRLMGALVYSKVELKSKDDETNLLIRRICSWAKYKTLYLIGGWAHPHIAELLKTLILEIELELKELTEQQTSMMDDIFTRMLESMQFSAEQIESIQVDLRIAATKDTFPYFYQVVKIMGSEELYEELLESLQDPNSIWRSAFPKEAFEDEPEKEEKTIPQTTELNPFEDIQGNPEEEIATPAAPTRARWSVKPRYLPPRMMKSGATRVEQVATKGYFGEPELGVQELTDAERTALNKEVRNLIIATSKLAVESRPKLGLSRRYFFIPEKQPVPEDLQGISPISKWSQIPPAVRKQLWLSFVSNSLRSEKHGGINVKTTQKIITELLGLDQEFREAFVELCKTGGSALSNTNPEVQRALKPP